MTDVAFPSAVKPPRAIAPPQLAYAFERSLGIPPAEACRRAGGKVENGHATKWEKAARVQAWISYYRSLGHTDEMIAAKRTRIEERLELAAFGNIFDFAVVQEPILPRDWSPSEKAKFFELAPEMQAIILKRSQESKGVQIDWETVLASPYGAIISGFKFDKDTGVLVDFERDNALQALAQLRDMHGFKAPAKTEHTGANGGPMEVLTVTDADRIKALQALLARDRAAA